METLAAVLLELQQMADDHPFLLLLDFSELMYTRAFEADIRQHRPLARLLAHSSITHAALVIPGTFDSPLATLVQAQHDAEGVGSALSIVGDVTAARQTLCQQVALCCGELVAAY